MPRWAARLFLEVTAVRVERLLDISEADAEAEGLYRDVARGDLWWKSPGQCRNAEPCVGHKPAFAQAWHRFHSNRGDDWDSNPWVWIYEFTTVAAR